MLLKSELDQARGGHHLERIEEKLVVGVRNERKLVVPELEALKGCCCR
jgi:hypothetical protein